MEQRAVGKAVRTGRRIRRAKRAAVIVGAVKLASTRRRAAAVALASKPQRRMRAR